MDFQLSFSPAPSKVNIAYADKIMLCGSCFTEHMGKKLEDAKFEVLQNPQGILFNPSSIAEGLNSIIENRQYKEAELFYHNEIWNHWQFHSRFSNMDKAIALEQINASVREAHQFLKSATVLVITLGSSFQYYLQSNDEMHSGPEMGVANCHKVPAKYFLKKLLAVDEMYQAWRMTLEALKAFNPSLNIIWTISPVRHYRDGLVENNRSKAGLIELTHRLASEYEFCEYFPAYEFVIDVLRDYRFFETDMVHPNALATQYVWEQFVDVYMHADTKSLINKVQEIITAAQHKPRFAETESHQKFKSATLRKIAELQSLYKGLNFDREIQLLTRSDNNSLTLN